MVCFNTQSFFIYLSTTKRLSWAVLAHYGLCICSSTKQSSIIILERMANHFPGLRKTWHSTPQLPPTCSCLSSLAASRNIYIGFYNLHLSVLFNHLSHAFTACHFLFFILNAQSNKPVNDLSSCHFYTPRCYIYLVIYIMAYSYSQSSSIA
jgi:hypothetical protein